MASLIRQRLWLFLLVAVVALLLVALSPALCAAPACSYTLTLGSANGLRAPSIPPYIKRSSSAITITADGRTLLAVNPDSNSLSIVDLQMSSTVTEILVGADPRTVAVGADGRRAYTANRAGNSISVIDLAAREAIAEIAVGARPYGVVLSPEGDTLYISVQGHDRAIAVDTTTLAKTWTIPVADRPSGLAISNDGRFLFVTHLLTSSITVVLAQPYTSYLPILQAASGPTNTNPGTMENANQVFTSPITLWPDSNLVQSIVLSPDGRQAFVPHTRSNSSNRALTLDTTVFPLVSLIDIPNRQHLVGQQLNLDILDPPSVGLPFDAAFKPGESELWVVNAASNDLTVINLNMRHRVAHIEVEDNPRGLVISPDGQTAYVNNTLAGSISVIDTTTYQVTNVITSTQISLDPFLLTGKQLFHSSDDPRLGKDQWMSCNTCHFDGENDGQTWILGFAGPRNTTSLLGMRDTLPLRWSGEWDEAADSEFAIRMDSFGTGLVDGEMHCSLNPPDCTNQPPHANISAELDALAAYISSLILPLNPEHIAGQPLSTAARRGMILFNDPSVGCATCHPPPLYTDNLIHNVGTASQDERIGPAFNTPSLRGIYDTPPYFHNGSADSLLAAINRPSAGSEHDLSSVLNETQMRDIVAFLSSLPYQH